MGVVEDDGHSGAVTIQWSRLNGPGTVTFGDEHAPITTATFSTPGVYTLNLAATNSAGTTNSEVMVQAEVAPAVEIITGDQSVAYNGTGFSASLDGTAADTDGGPNALSAAWELQYRANPDVLNPVVAPPITFSPAGLTTTATVTFSPEPAAPVTFPFRLRATDGAVFVYQPCVVTVGEVDNPPTIDSTSAPAYAYEGWTVNVSCTASDPDAGDSVASYNWSQVSGKTVTINGSGASVSYTAPALTLFTDTPVVVSVAAVDTRSVAGTPENISVPIYLMGDVNHDNSVNVSDLQALAAAWSTQGSSLAADLNGDTYVNVGDLQALIGNWNRSLH